MASKSKSFEFLATHLPVNKTAQMVVFSHSNFKEKLPKKHSYNPRIIVKVVDKNNTFIDFSNTSFGNLTVIGKCKKRGYSTGAWLIRCSCGLYIQKNAKFIKKNIKNQSAKCLNCKKKDEISFNHQAKYYGIRKYLGENTKKYIGITFGKYKILNVNPHIHSISQDDPYQVQFNARCECNFEFKTTLKKLEKNIDKHGLCPSCNEIQKRKDKEFFDLCGKWPHEV